MEELPVSVIIPAMNRAGLIGRALRSVAGQTRPPAEVIVVDDASDDDTVAVAREAGALVLRQQPRQGSGPARNLGIARARGRWVAFLDSDDEWMPDHLELLWSHTLDARFVSAPAVRQDGRAAGHVGRRTTIGPTGVLVPHNPIVTSGTLVRKDVLIKAGLFRPLARAQDLDLWIRVLEQTPGLLTGAPTVVYHEHAQQASLDSHLTHEAFDGLFSTYEARPWMNGRLKRHSYVRVHWDGLRAAQVRRDWRVAGAEATWLATRPGGLPTLGRLLRARRAQRKVHPARVEYVRRQVCADDSSGAKRATRPPQAGA